MSKTKTLALSANAPKVDFTIEIGMDFSRTFKPSDAPFHIEKKWADVLLRSYDYFVEFEETEPEAMTLASLMKLKRDVLNAKAKEFNISEPEKLADKKAVAEAILQAAKLPAKAADGADAAETPSDEKSGEETEEKEQG
ncbi:MAG TPA: hypothetical protein VGC76_14515 [Pyrinomonadaceae bacterium]|jgi:hypothetical protein